MPGGDPLDDACDLQKPPCITKRQMWAQRPTPLWISWASEACPKIHGPGTTVETERVGSDSLTGGTGSDAWRFSAGAQTAQRSTPTPIEPKRRSSMPETYLALLRGINVGGKNKLPMKELTVMFSEAGCENVRTYIQSGNVIFRAARSVSARLPGRITTQITERFGYRTPVQLRTTEQLEDVISSNPFLKAGAAEETLYVLFLADLPSQLSVDNLNPDRSPPDTFIVRGQEVYLQLPNGVARSKLTNDYFDSKLMTTSTGRNWRTVNKLLELMKG
jgi:uncharacterized protein (DUF1697 family)